MHTICLPNSLTKPPALLTLVNWISMSRSWMRPVPPCARQVFCGRLVTEERDGEERALERDGFALKDWGEEGRVGMEKRETEKNLKNISHAGLDQGRVHLTQHPRFQTRSARCFKEATKAECGGSSSPGICKYYQKIGCL